MSSMLLALAAAAGDPLPAITAEQALANARALTSAAKPKSAPCPESANGEIVVCAEHEDPAKQYVPSDTDSGDPDDGVARAPDFAPHFHGNIVDAKGCFIPPCAGPPPLIIDLKAIPEAPPGSDADKIARGEKAAP